MRVWFVILLLAGCALSPKKEIKFKEHPLAMVQGVTTKDQTLIGVVAPYLKNQTLSYELLEVTAEDELKVVKRVESIFRRPSPQKDHIVEHVHLRGLSLDKSYKLRVLVGGKILDERSFSTLDTSKKNIRIGVASCMDDYTESDEIWSSYLNKFTDLNFFIGDNVYADRMGPVAKKADPNQIWLRYLQTFNKLYFYHAEKLTPTYAVWDDHDYGKNDSGKDYKHKIQSLEIFRSFFPVVNIMSVYKTTLGAGSVLEAFGQKFLFVDNRYFRTDKSHWGEEQINLVMSELKDSALKNQRAWIIQGDQFFGAYHPFESYEALHSEEFKSVLDQIKKTKAKVVFVSGDRHLTEVMKIEKDILGYPSYEFTSSGIHAKVFPGSFKKHPNPRQILGKDGVYNYMIFELNEIKPKKIKVQSYGTKDWVHFSKELSL